MSCTIQVKRGLSSNLGAIELSQGELAFTTDSKKLYVGTGGGGMVELNVDAPTLQEIVEQLGTGVTDEERNVWNAKVDSANPVFSGGLTLFDHAGDAPPKLWPLVETMDESQWSARVAAAAEGVAFLGTSVFDDYALITYYNSYCDAMDIYGMPCAVLPPEFFGMLLSYLYQLDPYVPAMIEGTIVELIYLIKVQRDNDGRAEDDLEYLVDFTMNKQHLYKEALRDIVEFLDKRVDYSNGRFKYTDNQTLKIALDSELPPLFGLHYVEPDPPRAVLTVDSQGQTEFASQVQGASPQSGAVSAFRNIAFGTAVPSSSIGQNGDLYFMQKGTSASGEIYLKINGAWVACLK